MGMRKYFLLIILTVPVAAFSEEVITLNGKVGDSPVSASLQFMDSGKIEGFYFYNKHDVKIPLEGEFLKDEWGKVWKHIRLKSTSQSPEEVFDGYIETRFDAHKSNQPYIEISGNWLAHGIGKHRFIFMQNEKIDLDRDYCRNLPSDPAASDSSQIDARTLYQCKIFGVYTAADDAASNSGIAAYIGIEKIISKWLMDGELFRARLIAKDKEKVQFLDDSQKSWELYVKSQCDLEGGFFGGWFGTSYSQFFHGRDASDCLIQENYLRAESLNRIFTWGSSDSDLIQGVWNR